MEEEDAPNNMDEYEANFASSLEQVASGEQIGSYSGGKPRNTPGGPAPTKTPPPPVSDYFGTQASNRATTVAVPGFGNPLAPDLVKKEGGDGDYTFDSDGPSPLDLTDMISGGRQGGGGKIDVDDSTKALLKAVIEGGSVKNEQFKQLAKAKQELMDKYETVLGEKDRKLQELSDRMKKLGERQLPEDYDPQWRRRMEEIEAQNNDLRNRISLVDLQQDPLFQQEVDTSSEMKRLDNVFASLRYRDDDRKMLIDRLVAGDDIKRVDLLRQIEAKIQQKGGIMSQMDYQLINSALAQIDSKNHKREQALKDHETYRHNLHFEQQQREQQAMAVENQLAYDWARSHSGNFAARANEMPELYGDLSRTGSVAKNIRDTALATLERHAAPLMGDRKMLAVTLTEGFMNRQERDIAFQKLRELSAKYNELLTSLGRSANPGAGSSPAPSSRPSSQQRPKSPSSESFGNVDDFGKFLENSIKNLVNHEDPRR